MSAYRVAQNQRELRLMQIGLNRGMRIQLMALARGTNNRGLASVARGCNRDMVRTLVALKGERL